MIFRILIFFGMVTGLAGVLHAAIPSQLIHATCSMGYFFPGSSKATGTDNYRECPFKITFRDTVDGWIGIRPYYCVVPKGKKNCAVDLEIPGNFKMLKVETPTEILRVDKARKCTYRTGSPKATFYITGSDSFLHAEHRLGCSLPVEAPLLLDYGSINYPSAKASITIPKLVSFGITSSAKPIEIDYPIQFRLAGPAKIVGVMKNGTSTFKVVSNTCAEIWPQYRGCKFKLRFIPPSSGEFQGRFQLAFQTVYGRTTYGTESVVLRGTAKDVVVEAMPLPSSVEPKTNVSKVNRSSERSQSRL